MIATLRQRNTSLTNALTYGSRAESSQCGERAGPITASISACAFSMASGNAQHASTKVTSVLLDVSAPAPKRFPVSPDSSATGRLYLAPSSNSVLTYGVDIAA